MAIGDSVGSKTATQIIQEANKLAEVDIPADIDKLKGVIDYLLTGLENLEIKVTISKKADSDGTKA